MKQKYIDMVAINTKDKVDIVFGYQFDDPDLDYQKDQIVEDHIRLMMLEIEELLNVRKDN